MNKKLELTSLTVLGLSSIWISTFLFHPKFKNFSIDLYDNKKHHIEFFPDFIVSYNCSNYKQIDGLLMESSNKEVRVNYGGFGRRRGLANFQCLDK